MLRAWEADADLRSTREALRFEFDGTDIIDRSPPPPGVIRGRLHALTGNLVVTATGTVSSHMTFPHYPKPPGTFRLSPDAESILLRYQRYLDGREPLLAMAYFCLTVLLASTRAPKGKRASAAKKYKIEEGVLKKMGDLTSEKHGDRSSARKATTGRAQPTTSSEQAWLEAALKALIWRLGDTRPPAALPRITLADLPRL